MVWRQKMESKKWIISLQLSLEANDLGPQKSILDESRTISRLCWSAPVCSTVF